MTLPAIVASHLTVGYPGRIVLEDLNLEVPRGCWLALLGPNASGKSTLLKCLGGRLPPLHGSVQINGRDIHSMPRDERAMPGHAVAPEELPPFLTIRQCLEIHALAHGLPGVPPTGLELARGLGLDAHADVQVRHASLGTRQKLAIVLALARQPQVLLLDEVFNALDFGSTLYLREHLRERVRRDALTIVLATHSLDIVCRCCDGFVLLQDGRMAGRWDTAGLPSGDRLQAIEQVLAAAAAPRSQAGSPGPAGSSPPADRTR
jgi:ABC-2 type transport system ATP-binding protein